MRRRAILAVIAVLAVTAVPAGAQVPIISFSPSPVNFGNIAVGQQVPATVTATNNSMLAKTIDAVHVRGSGFDRVAGGSCGPAPFFLASHDSCTVTVRFTPPTADVFSGRLQFDYDSASGNSVDLIGTGTQPALLFEPASLTFADRTIGTTSAPAPISIRNEGQASLQVSGVAIDGPQTSDFEIVGGSCPSAVPFSLSPAQSCTKSIVFAPTGPGQRIASLAVSDNAPGSPHSAALAGDGIALSEPKPDPGPTPDPEPDPLPAKADATIKRVTDRAAVGDDVYVDAEQQTRTWAARPRQGRTFLVGIENDGLGAGTITVAGCAKVAKFKVRYFAGEENVSAAVKAGTYVIDAPAPGASTELTLEMTPKKSAEPKSRGVCVTTAADDGAIDAVAASVKVKPAV